MAGLIGKKIGMTSMFSEEGKNIPCTIIEAGPCTVTQIKTKETDGTSQKILFLRSHHLGAPKIQKFEQHHTVFFFWGESI